MLKRQISRSIDLVASRGAACLLNAAAVRLQKRVLPSSAWGTPVFAQVEITTHCNLECPMCPRNSPVSGPRQRPLRDKPGHMSPGKFKDIVDRFPGLLDICLNGLGEPLLNPELGKMVEYCRKKHIRSGFITNGTLLDAAKTETLIHAGLDDITVSVDAADRKSFERIRKGADFEKVTRNIASCIETRDHLGSKGPRVHIMFVRMRSNIGQLDDVKRLARRIGVEAVIEKDLIDTGDTAAESPSIAPTGRSGSHPRCRWPWQGVYINLEGDVSPCCNAPQAVFGNILNPDGNRIWNSDTYRTFRKDMKAAVSALCGNCPDY